MDRQLKQRLVGAAVLVVMGVIFIPLFLESGSNDKDVVDVAQLPEAPEAAFKPGVEPLEESEISAFQQEAIAGQLPQAIKESVPEVFDTAVQVDPDSQSDEGDGNPSKPIKEEKPIPANPAPKQDATASNDEARDKGGEEAPPKNAASSDDAWTVQLGSFSNVENARRLIDRLRDKGYPGYLERQLDSGATVFKVRVGPQVGRADALAVRERLTKEFELKGMLVKYR